MADTASYTKRTIGTWTASWAIKIIVQPPTGAEDRRRRAQREAQILERLRHENIARGIDAGVTETGMLYIIMELLEGLTMRSALKARGRFTVTEALTVTAAIADALQVAHELGVVHRDLKPANVFLTEGNVPKVLDFGIAKVLGRGYQTTDKQLVQGTLMYMSPEQLMGGAVTPLADMYACGSMLYEMLCGYPPCLVIRKEPSHQEIVLMHLSELPPPLDTIARWIPSYVARPVQRMIAKDASQRFTSMAEIAALLRRNCKRFQEENQGPETQIRPLWTQPAGTSVRDLSSSSSSAPPVSVGASTIAVHGRGGDTAKANARGGDTAKGDARMGPRGTLRIDAPAKPDAATKRTAPLAPQERKRTRAQERQALGKRQTPLGLSSEATPQDPPRLELLPGWLSSTRALLFSSAVLGISVGLLIVALVFPRYRSQGNAWEPEPSSARTEAYAPPAPPTMPNVIAAEAPSSNAPALDAEAKLAAVSEPAPSATPKTVAAPRPRTQRARPAPKPSAKPKSVFDELIMPPDEPIMLRDEDGRKKKIDPDRPLFPLPDEDPPNKKPWIPKGPASSSQPKTTPERDLWIR